ncbi:MAG: formylglycine-generating enzyme family protein [Pseudomonadota bacterium]|nr:formylglycine-generating enzyme family protein [Pseudomonadota bacterium]
MTPALYPLRLIAGLAGLALAGIGDAHGAGALKAGAEFEDCGGCPKMVVVPAGSFVMGSPRGEKNHEPGEAPQQKVRIASPFAVGKYEVTFAEWDACVAGGGCNGHRPKDQDWGRDSVPVMNVSWDDAKAYVAWLSARSGKTYRLLSEAEWEYAARAGHTSPYPTGATIGTDQANYNGDFSFSDRGKGEYRGKAIPAGSFPPNKFGLHDMAGNVFEWVEDCWNPDHKGAPNDGSARVNGDCGSRVFRGGSWFSNLRYMRSAFRTAAPAHFHYDYLGLRVARDLTPEELR